VTLFESLNLTQNLQNLLSPTMCCAKMLADFARTESGTYSPFGDRI